MSHYICQAAFFYFGDEGPKSSWMRHLPPHHLYAKFKQRNKWGQHWETWTCFTEDLDMEFHEEWIFLWKTCLLSDPGESRPLVAWLTSCLMWCVQWGGRPLWTAATKLDAAGTANIKNKKRACFWLCLAVQKYSGFVPLHAHILRGKTLF